MKVDWQSFRSHFPITERLIYLNTGWAAPASREVIQAIEARLEREGYDGTTTPEVRHEKALLVRAARAALGSVVGAPSEAIALTYTTTEGINAVLSGLGLCPGDEILTCNLEHSSVMVPCYEQQRRRGVAVQVVRSSAEEDTEELGQIFESAISAKTKLVVLSHISYNRGTRLPVERIIRAAHAAGAYVLLDGAQSAGQIAVDVRALEVDFYSFPGHKYVMGPSSVAALYIRPDLIEHVEASAVAHGASEYYDFEGHFTPQTKSMAKFEMTTHSGPLLAGAIEAVRQLHEIGIVNIQSRIVELSTRLIDGLQRIPSARIRGPLDPALRSGLVTFTVGELDPHETCAALWQLRRVVARVVNDKRVRLAIAAFNSEDDIDAALEAIERLAARGLPPGTMTAQQFKQLVAEEDD